MLLLLSVVKSLFNHIWDVVRDVPSFQSEYGSILQLLVVKEYRFHMRKRVYCCEFVFLHWVYIKANGPLYYTPELLVVRSGGLVHK